MKRRACSVTALFALIAVGATARADLDGDLFTRELFGYQVSLVTPKNWNPTEERSYPSVLLWMSRRDPPGRMLLSAERLDGSLDAFGYAKRSTALLETLGFTVRPPQLHSSTGAYWIDFDNGAVYLRQAFLVVGPVGYALTLSAPDSRTRGQHLRAFDYALRHIAIHRADRSQPAPEAAPPAGAPIEDADEPALDAGPTP